MRSRSSPTASQPVGTTTLSHRLLTETIVSFAEAARHFRMHVGTLHRWRTRGLRGVRLEAARAGRWITSWQALDRFITAVAAVQAPHQTAAAPVGRRSSAIERELTAEGL